MKKLFSISGLLVGAVIALAAVGASIDTPVSAAAKCTAQAVGPRASAFTINGNNATVKFKVKGQENCKVQLSAISFYAPTMDGRPYEKQIRYDITTKTFKPGSYSLSVKLPPNSTKKKGCFYQVDLTYGTRNHQPVLAYGHGKLNCGEKPEKIKVCELSTKKIITIEKKDFDKQKHTKDLDKCKEAPKDIEVCELSTKDIITIKEKDFDAAKHSNDLNDCKEETPNKVTVCELDTKKIVTIDEKDFDAAKHSNDLNDCKEVPVVEEAPKESTPEELPTTGPAETMVSMLGLGSLVASAGYYLQSRRQL